MKIIKAYYFVWLTSILIILGDSISLDCNLESVKKSWIIHKYEDMENNKIQTYFLLAINLVEASNILALLVYL